MDSLHHSLVLADFDSTVALALVFSIDIILASFVLVIFFLLLDESEELAQAYDHDVIPVAIE
jgi:hypothetical protein